MIYKFSTRVNKMLTMTSLEPKYYQEKPLKRFNILYKI